MNEQKSKLKPKQNDWTNRQAKLFPHYTPSKEITSPSSQTLDTDEKVLGLDEKQCHDFIKQDNGVI